MRQILLLSSLSFVAACGRHADNDLSRADAYAASQATTSQTNVEAMGTTGLIAYSVNQSYDTDCPGGGSVAMDVAASGDVTSADNMSIDMAASVTYDACSVGDITVEGNAAMNVSMRSNMGAYAMSAQVSGDAWFTGAIEGSCSFNYTMTMDASSSTQTGSIHVSGSYCGYDLEELDAEFGAGLAAPAGN